MRLFSIAFLLALLPLGTANATAPDSPTGDHIVQRSHATMGTLVVITAWTDDETRAAAAFAEAFAEFDRIDRLMSIFRPDSEISRVNAAAGAPKGVPVSDEILFVVDKAIEASRLSRGAFDVTVGAFAGLWKFDEDKDGTIPPPELVAERRKLVSFRDVVVSRRARTIRLRRPGQKINLGGIAKGYAVDRAVAILRRHGLGHFIVQAGGDLYVSGRRGDRAWRVGIRDPRGGRDVFFAFAEVEDATFSTSGDYERFVLRDGRRYHHILDPATGYPATRSRSVTVVAKDATTADALSTALFVMGVEAGMKLVERLPDVEAVFVDAQNRVHISSGLRGKLTILQSPTDGP